MRIEETNQIIKDAKSHQVELEPEPTDLKTRMRELGTRVRNDGGAWLNKNRNMVGAATGAVVAVSAAAVTLLKRRRKSYKWYDLRRMK